MTDQDSILNRTYEELKAKTELTPEETNILKLLEDKISLSISDEQKREMEINELVDILGKTIKQDNTNKLISFLGMLSTYTESNQFNVSFRAPSSTGKSYIPLELSYLFPSEDVMKIAYSSPTAFFHDKGTWNAEDGTITINLHQKILIFMDQPHDQLLQRLRPLLSHDQKELTCKITDRSEKYGQKTKNIKLVGYPSVFFCTGSLNIDEQETTRNVLLSPETTEEKIREAIQLKLMKEANKTKYDEWVNSDERRKFLIQRIRAIKEEGIKQIIIPNEIDIFNRYRETQTKLKPRASRDIERLCSIIKSLALLNCWTRERNEEMNLLASQKDVDNAFSIWSEIALSQELGIPPFVYKVFEEVVKPICTNGTNKKEIAVKYLEKYGRYVSDRYLTRELIPAMENSGLIYEELNPDNRREKLIYAV